MSQNAFLAFTAMVLAVSAWSIMKPDVDLNILGDPAGDPEEWTLREMQVWLGRRGLDTSGTREEVLERVMMRMRARK
ncbi:hypothetical protein L873DRAFT_1818052 [Choiromyces venosus 120613-1]|uniref:SAP domain-containing protein n=1 Tax=Choiromyces venosus 120613-1 TaxID=1336337 RepID=A0A3N4J1A9_9PEZI|nr:hypothetical protein L873DRAFT_1818052 [Choiromyces venosus 120613-1]